MWRRINFKYLVILIIACLVFYVVLFKRDRVAPALDGFRDGWKGYEVIKKDKDRRVSDFDKARAKIKPPVGLEAERNALNQLGYDTAIRDCK